MALRVATLVIALGSTGVTIALYRASARRKELDALGQKIAVVAADLAVHKEAGQDSRAALSERLGHVEQTLTQLPDRETVHNLALGQSDMRGDIKAMAEKLLAIGATASRVESFLLSAAKDSRP